MKKRELRSENTRKNVPAEQNAAYAAALKQMVDCKTVWDSAGANHAEFELGGMAREV